MAVANSTLSGCVASLRSSMQLLESSINILDAGVSDLPRLSTVLQTTRVRDLPSLFDQKHCPGRYPAGHRPQYHHMKTQI